MRDLQSLERVVGRALDRSLRVLEREIISIYTSVRDEVQAVLAEVYRKYSIDGVLTRAQMSKYNRLANLEKQLNTIVGHGTQKTRATIERLTRQQYNEAFFRHGWAVDQHLGVSLKWGLLRTQDIAAAVENPLRLIAEDRLRTLGREKIRRVVAQGLVRGDSYAQMSREIQNAILAKGKESLRYNALRVARTEGGRAQTLGTLAAYDEAERQGVEMERVWVATLDDRTRDTHQDMDGVVEGDDGLFPTPVGRVAGPRLSGVPEFDINCRCTIIAQVKDLPIELERRIRDEGVKPYQTYREWRPR